MLGKINAANMHDGRWMFTRLTEDERPAGGLSLSCVLIGVRQYDAYDVVLVVDWMAERAAGYPGLARFEDGANWPPSISPICSGCEGGTWHRDYVA